ncbi:extracellular solute-binding protein [Alteromonas sp. 5E99-2]|uniref:extracellular solute-binding protein n=1 Tax=Alteromonas sp. 5E99-2 TaxID=2817683 RepID=UPI001A9837BE|nr:extracellular solute-binding protein [Alteromonas sp. 5E99-2]
MNYFRVIALSCLFATTVTSFTAVSKEINVYSARKEALIKPLLDKFTEQTGIDVNLVTGKADGLISRMQSEGALSPVDILITTDAGRLVRAKTLGLTKPIPALVNLDRVDDALFDTDRHWTALTLRARPIMYSPERVDVTGLSTLEALADAQWRGRICIRSSNNIYNQSMVASLIEQLGAGNTQSWAEGFVKNFARPPAGGDRDQIKAVVAGQCDIAIANTYYLAGMRESADADTKEVASKIKVFWPNQDDRGAHVNISGVALAKHAKNSDEAVALISFMLANSSQEWYSEVNGEYPVVEGVSWSETLEAMGRFKAESVSLQLVGERNAEALRLMDRAGWK